jgi:hypothetical protein
LATIDVPPLEWRRRPAARAASRQSKKARPDYRVQSLHEGHGR